MGGVLAYWRRVGGRELGKRLCTFGGVLIRLEDHREAVAVLEESLTLLPPSEERFHFAAIFNLAVCRIELSTGPTELEAAAPLVARIRRLAKPGTTLEFRWHWLVGNLYRRMDRLDESLAELQAAQSGIDERSNGFDRALLLLDLTDLHLERDDTEAARKEALSSFGVMTAFRNEPLALRAIQRLHHAAQSLSLDRATVRAVRRDVLAARS